MKKIDSIYFTYTLLVASLFTKLVKMLIGILKVIFGFSFYNKKVFIKVFLCVVI